MWPAAITNGWFINNVTMQGGWISDGKNGITVKVWGGIPVTGEYVFAIQEGTDIKMVQVSSVPI